MTTQLTAHGVSQIGRHTDHVGQKKPQRAAHVRHARQLDKRVKHRATAT